MKSLLFILMVVNSIAATTDDPNGCFPKSDIRFSRFDKSSGGLTENDFLRMKDKFKSIFDPIVFEKFGKKISFENCWKDDSINAYCTRDMEDNPVIKIMGGLIRHPDMTMDALYLLACHELGHYLGGAPKAFRGRTNERSWSSAEGQADYFATTKCLPLIFNSDKETEKSLDFAPYDQIEKAKIRCKDKSPQCIRMALAAATVAYVFHTITPYEDLPELDKKDLRTVFSTFYSHPAPQCRLDTFINGLNCKTDMAVFFDPIDPKIGACLEDGSSRPLCWYLPEEKFN